MPAALLADMLAQKLVSFWIENTDVKRIPLDVDEFSNPAWRGAVIGRVHFDTPIQMHGAFAILVITEGLQRQGKQEGLFLGEHGCDLSLRRSVDARIGPAQFPVVQIGLSLFKTFEAQPLQWRLLGVADARFHFPLSIGVLDAARHRHHAVVRQDILEQWIQSGIVDVRLQHALFQIIENDGATAST